MKEIIFAEYKYRDKAKDAKCSVRLVFKAKDACNKKNPLPRPKVTYKRCYDLKDGFTSVSNFYEIDAEEADKVADLINAVNSADLAPYKPFDAFPNKDYSKIVIKTKNGLKKQITKACADFEKIKASILTLVQ